MTLTPTQNPARARRDQRSDAGVLASFDTTSASAKKFMPMAICCEATPQQAVAKKTELSMAASAPRHAARDDNFNALKKVQPPIPKMNSAISGRNFAYP